MDTKSVQVAPCSACENSQEWGLAVGGVEVRRAGQLVPLISSNATLSSMDVSWDGMALESHSAPACVVPDHEHPTHFLQLQRKGPVKYEWTTGGRTRIATAEPGTIFVCPTGTRDRVRWDGPTSRIAVVLHPQLLARTLEKNAHLRNVELQEHWQLRDRHIESLMLALQADIEDGSPAGRLYGESIGVALAHYLLQRYAVWPDRTSEYRGGMPPVRLNRVLEYLHENHSRNLRLWELAQVAEMGSHYFSELFKQSTGLSPYQYVLRLRVQRARELLRQPDVRVSEVAAATGFADQSHFTKVFRRIVGTTPAQFRAAL